MLFFWGSIVQDVGLAVVDELSGYRNRSKAVIYAAWPAVVHPRLGPADPLPTLTVAADVQAQVGVGVVAPIAILAHHPQRVGHKLTRDADVQTAYLAHRHLVEFEVGRQVGLPVHRKNHLFGRPVKEISAFLPADLALAVQKVPVMGVLAVGDPLLDRLVPDDALEVMVAVRRILVDGRPAQAVGRGNHRGHVVLALRTGAVVGVVEHQVFAVGVALVVVSHQPDVMAGILQHDVGRFVSLVGQAAFAQRLFPVQAVGGLGIAEHHAGVAVGVTAERLRVPEFELVLVGVV